MPQGMTDGRRPKFRLLCRACNSYMHTDMHLLIVTVEDEAFPTWGLSCTKCGNTAKDLREEFPDGKP